MSFQNLHKRITTLEARSDSNISNDERHPAWCDPYRRLARYSAYFKGQQWECTGTPQQKARRDAKLARYKAYFDNLGVHVR
jgi:hypothetical protein